MDRSRGLDSRLAGLDPGWTGTWILETGTWNLEPGTWNSNWKWPPLMSISDLRAVGWMDVSSLVLAEFYWG